MYRLKGLSIDFSHKLLQAYEQSCKELCRKVSLPQTAFDILMFLANNSQYKMAKDIVEVRKIKATLVSANVERLVNEGYLERTGSQKDRRSIILSLTPKAEPIVEQGRKVQDEFTQKLFCGLSDESIEQFRAVLNSVNKNIENILEEGKK